MIVKMQKIIQCVTNQRHLSTDATVPVRTAKYHRYELQHLCRGGLTSLFMLTVYRYPRTRLYHYRS